MKKKLVVLFAIFAVVIAGGAIAANIASESQRQGAEDEMTVVTSFYPMYILTANLVKNVDQVTVVNLTENQTGCLHDYQLTTQDMIQLDSADLLVMNGGGMESFIENVVSSYPDLSVIDASEGIDMLLSTSEHSHEHGEEEEDHEEDDHEEEHNQSEYNAHVWMNMNDYLKQMEHVYEGLVTADPVHEKMYEDNYQEYRQKVEDLKAEFEEELSDVAGKQVVIFHDSFAYLAQELGLDVVYTINMDDETYLSAGEVKEIIDEVNLHGVKVLFTEEQYSDSIAESIAKETDAKVYIINSLVTGDMDLDAYLNGMRDNLNVIKEALR